VVMVGEYETKRGRIKMLFNECKTILDLCGGTGSWSEPYKKAGYNVRLIDLETTGEDVRLFQIPKETIYGILAAPPCTHLAKSGAAWWEKKGEGPLLEALAVADACMRIVVATSPKFWALENPVGRLSRYLGPARMHFNPCDYGDPYTKKTALWGVFNPPGKWSQVAPIKPRRGHHSMDAYLMEKGKKLTQKDRAALRSITPPAFAQAFFEANP